MGHAPPPPPIPDDPGAWPDWHVRALERELRGRRSWFRWKRRRAYEACLLLIVHREHVCGRRVYEPPPAAEKPVETTNFVQVFESSPVELVDGSGRIVAVISGGGGAGGGGAVISGGVGTMIATVRDDDLGV